MAFSFLPATSVASPRDETLLLEPTASAYRPARILIHAINFAPELIGCGKYTTELAEFLARRGHRVDVVTAPPHYPGWRVRAPYRAFAYVDEKRGAITVTRCPMLMKANGGGVWRLLAPLSFALTAAPMVIWRILWFRPDVVMCVEPTLFSAPAALLAAKLVGARSILHVQDLEVDAAFAVGHLAGTGVRRFANALERSLLGAFDRVVTISRKMRAALIAKGVTASQVEVLRNWVDLEAIKPQGRCDVNAFRAELGIPDDRFVVLYAGHVGVKQALPVLLDAARRLDGDSRIYFVIAGDGPKKAELQQRYAGLANVLYLPLQPAERLADLLNMADLHVLPQHKGAADLVMPSKLGGMLASGRAVVAAAEPGTELFDILQDVALLVPTGDDAAMADAISRAAVREDPIRIENGLRLAASLSSRRLLPRFEALLLDDRFSAKDVFDARACDPLDERA